MPLPKKNRVTVSTTRFHAVFEVTHVVIMSVIEKYNDNGVMIITLVVNVAGERFNII